MQEEIEQRTVTLIINGTKFSGRVLKGAITKYMAHRRNIQHQKHINGVTAHGKMSVKQLAAQNQGMTSFEMQKDDGIRQFERVCRRYGVDYAVHQVKGDKPRYIIFVKGRDKDAITAAFTEFMDTRMRRKQQNRLPLARQLKRVMARAPQSVREAEKRKVREQSR